MDLNKLRLFVNIGTAIGIGLGLTACGQVNSEDVKKTAWHATYSLDLEDGRVFCRATFRVSDPNGTFIILDRKTETVTCNGVTMTEEKGFFGEVYYKADMRDMRLDYSEIILESPDGVFVADGPAPTRDEFLDLPQSMVAKKGQSFDVKWSAKSTPGSVRGTLSYSSSKASGLIFADAPSDSGSLVFTNLPTSEFTGSGPFMGSVKLSKVQKGMMPSKLRGKFEILSSKTHSVRFED